MPKLSEPEHRNQVRQQIAQDIYSTVERGPMSFIADRGESAVLLAELAIKRLEAAGWVPPEPREYGVALIPYGKEKWRYPRLGEYGNALTDAEETLRAIQTAEGVAAKAKIVSRTKAGKWEDENG